MSYTNFNHKSWGAQLLALAALTLPPVSLAQIQLGDNIQLSGFGTVSAAKTDNETPILFSRDITDEWCFDCDTTLGFQLNWQITTKLRTAVQVLKRPQDEFSSPELERAYIEYAFDSVRVQAGRLRVPLYIMSEYYYVSSAYPWLRLPSTVYNNNLGITHYEGISADWSFLVNDQIQVSINPYIAIPDKDDFELYGDKFTLDTVYAFGLSAEVYIEETLLHLAFSEIKTEQEGLISGNDTYELTFVSLGLSHYLTDALHLQAETLLESELYANWYVSLDYHLGQLTPYIQYGQARKNRAFESYLVGFRYDLTPQINTSVEWQRFSGRKNIISGEFTEPQNPQQPFASKVDLISIGISFTF